MEKIDYNIQNLINENYEIYEIIGEGHSGTVFKGKNIKNEIIAIKVIKKSYTTEEKIKKESDILKELNHQNVIKLFDVIELNNAICLITEYANLGDLFDYIPSDGFSTSISSAIIRQINLGLLYIHSKNIVHRDIKLENILCFSNENNNIIIKIADFGLSKIITEPSFASMCGSIEYCAPEILLSQKYDKKADCWSFGILCYVILTGCLPFTSYYNNYNYQSIQNIINNSIIWPENCNSIAHNFVTLLLKKLPIERSCCDELSSHPFISVFSELKLNTQNKKFYI